MQSETKVPYAMLSSQIELLLQADEHLIAAFWDEAQPASANYENIAYWLSQSLTDAPNDS